MIGEVYLLFDHEVGQIVGPFLIVEMIDDTSTTWNSVNLETGNQFFIFEEELRPTDGLPNTFSVYMKL